MRKYLSFESSLFCEKNIKYFLLLIVFFAGILRLYGLSEESLWIDETYTANIARLPAKEIIVNSLEDENHPPFYYLLMKIWVNIAGLSEKALRFPGAIAGSLGVFIAYLLGKEIFGKDVGLMTSLFYSSSYLQVYYAQEARVYVFFLLCSAASIWSYFLVLRDSKKINVILFIISTILTLYFHIFGVWVLFSLSIHFFVYGWIIRKWSSRRKTIVSSFLVIGLSLLPFLLWSIMRIQKVSGTFWISPPDFVEVMRTIVQFVPFFIPPFSSFETPILAKIFQENVLVLSNAILLSFFVLGICFSIIKIIVLNRNHSWKYILLKLDKAIFIVILSLGTFVIIILLSHLFYPVWIKRALLYASIPLLAFCAYVLLNLFPSRYAWFLALLFFIGSCGISVSHHFIKDKIPWREAISVLAKNYQKGDIIATYPDPIGMPYFSTNPIRYYANRYNRVEMEDWLSDDPDEIKAWLFHGDRLWRISRYGIEMNIEKLENQIQKISQSEFALMNFRSAIKIELFQSLKPNIH